MQIELSTEQHLTTCKIKANEALCRNAYDVVVAEIERCDYYVPGVGVGDFEETWSNAWVEIEGMHYGISVDLLREEIFISMDNFPEGDDALNPEHEHWFEMRDTAWIDLLPAFRKLIN